MGRFIYFPNNSWKGVLWIVIEWFFFWAFWSLLKVKGFGSQAFQASSASMNGFYMFYSSNEWLSDNLHSSVLEVKGSVLNGFRVWECPHPVRLLMTVVFFMSARRTHVCLVSANVECSWRGSREQDLDSLAPTWSESAALTTPLDDFSLLAGAIERSRIARLWGDRSEQNWWRIDASRLNPSHACSPRAHPSSSSSSSSCWCNEHDVPCLQQNHDRDLRTHHHPKPRHGL